MIAKHVAIRSMNKSSFVELVKYITDPQSKSERVGQVTVTHCHQSVALDAALEVEATQRQNTRARSDKTYHLILSFRAGENPNPAVLQAIEKSICEGLGYGAHQRISVVHHDTDNLHIHLAINKIHPVRHTIYEPYYDYKTLAKLCETLEQQHGLESDNHQTKKHLAENRAQDMERHTGIESLIGFIKRECFPALQSATSWEAIHTILAQHQLECRLQGNGVVLVDKLSNFAVKASSVDRSLSKGKLEARLGAFEKSRLQQNHQIGISPVLEKRSYQKSPVNLTQHTKELYALYQAEQIHHSHQLAKELATVKQQKQHSVDQYYKTALLKRSAIKLLAESGMTKKLLYRLAYQTLQKNLSQAQIEAAQKRQSIYEKYQRHAWADWLKKKALEGNSEALSTLRAREGRQSLKNNTVSSNKKIMTALPLTDFNNVTKKGTFIYQVVNAYVRDDGQRLEVSRDAFPASLAALLQMAIRRYGSCLTLNGSELFKRKMVQIAVASKMNITFDDTASERLRLYLLKSSTQEVNLTHDKSNTNRRTKNSRGDGRPRRTRSDIKRTQHARVANSRIGIKSQPTMLTAPPPPSRTHAVRNVSERDVVRNTRRSDLLLQKHVPRDVEHSRTQTDNALRRNIHGSGLIKNRKKIL
jgi:Fe-S cluster biosynthesis and repair protein YggX